MHIATFYSYKGGVGRTMALVNVGYLLANAGKRVLLVDFDLEAPGLPSYLPLPNKPTAGIVDFVHSYLEEGVSPNVENYILPLKLGAHDIWFMPAGKHTELTYSSELNEIDWGKLYAEDDGFLLMEDMKRQWEAYDDKGFDYVLLDSRTGHTDVGGICTRQLPDAVVVMFVPTPQNVTGLAPITRAIAQERAPVRHSRIHLHFCPSNLPDLDDQEDILKSLLNSAQDVLRFNQPAATIQHYRSLDLLQHPIYVLSKPNSRLAKQYGDLAQAIVSKNLSDKEGALAALRLMVDRYDKARNDNDVNALTSINADISIIRVNFPDDGEVAWQLAALANRMMRPEEELAALSVVIDSGNEPRFAKLQRARVLASLGESENALSDLERLLQHSRVTFFEALPAIDLLRALNPKEWRNTVVEALNNPQIDGLGKAMLLQGLLEAPWDAPNVVSLTERVLESEELEESRSHIRTVYTLALICAGRFTDAMAVISKDRSRLSEVRSASTIFNYAIAEWGATGRPPNDLFRQVLNLNEGKKSAADANYLQCLALCHIVLENREKAIDSLRSAEAMLEPDDRVFNCWRYLTVLGSEMAKDIAEMRVVASGGADYAPPFLRTLIAASEKELES